MSYNKKAIMRIGAILLVAVATLALMLPAVLTQANAAETDASTADQNAFVSVQGGKDSLVNDNGLLHGTYLPMVRNNPIAHQIQLSLYLLSLMVRNLLPIIGKH